VVGGATALIDLNLAHRAHQLSSLHTQRKAWTYTLAEIFTTDARFSHRGPMSRFLNCLICHVHISATTFLPLSGSENELNKTGTSRMTGVMLFLALAFMV
jgi:hypothetical protein